MTKLLEVDKEVIKIIYPGITDKQLEIEYDIFNGITISQKAKNRFPISEEEVDELIEKQSFIKILQAMDGNTALNDYNVSENVITYLKELGTPLKKIGIKKVSVCNGKSNRIKSKHFLPPIFEVKNRNVLRKICSYIAKHPNTSESKKMEKILEEQKNKIL